MAFKKHSDKTGQGTAATLSGCCIGEVVSLEKLPDVSFPERFIGEGFFMIPDEPLFVSPVSGEVKDVSDSGLDVTIKTAESLIVIISLDHKNDTGAQCDVCVKRGDVLTAGSTLWTVDENRGLIAIVVVTNCPDDSFEIRYGKVRQLGQPVMTIDL